MHPFEFTILIVLKLIFSVDEVDFFFSICGQFRSTTFMFFHVFAVILWLCRLHRPSCCRCSYSNTQWEANVSFLAPICCVYIPILVLFRIIYWIFLNNSFAVSANRLKLIGLMQVGKEKIPLVLYMLLKQWQVGYVLLFCYILTSSLFAGHYNIFVGDLSADVTDAALFTFFSVFPSCS